jgi:signal transduction histidine kinase
MSHPQLFVARLRPAVLVDAAVAAVALAGTLLWLSHSIDIPPDPVAHEFEPSGVALAVCGAVPLLAWRRFPLGVFAVTAATAVAQAALGYPVGLTIGPMAALYLLAAGSERRRWTVLVLFVASLGAVAGLQETLPLHTTVAWAGAWFAGERTRLKREQVAELKEHAVRDRLLAVAEERARIARDLHDSAAHAISVIAVRAGAARLRHDKEPDRSLPALRAIEDLARQTVTEIDQIVGTLRSPGDGGPPHGLASLDTVIARHKAAGLDVTVDTAGTPRSLSGAPDQAAYRILQEALTNAARHGAGTAMVELAYTGTAVDLTVTNPVRGNGRPRSGGGHGLIGMRERATLVGGSLHTECTGGAFRLRASIPYRGHRA